MKFSNRIGEHLKEFFTKDTIEFLPDGSYITRDYFPYEEGLIKFILGFGKDCEVVEPLFLKEDVGKYIKDLYLIFLFLF